MEVRLNIGLNQLIGVIHQLPKSDKIVLKRTIDDDLAKEKTEKRSDDLTALLLNGPVMNNEQYEKFKSLRGVFQKWQNNLSV